MNTVIVQSCSGVRYLLTATTRCSRDVTLWPPQRDKILLYNHQSYFIFSCHYRTTSKKALRSIINCRESADGSSTLPDPTDCPRRAHRGGEREPKEGSGTERQEREVKEGQTPLLAAASGEGEQGSRRRQEPTSVTDD